MNASNKIVIFGSLVAGVVMGLLVVFFVFQKPFIGVGTQTHVLVGPAEALPTPTLAPTVEPTPQGTSTEWISPEGNVTLIMKSIVTPENQNTYSFFVRSKDNSTEVLVFTKTIPMTSTMTIPFNSWSPGNQFFFVQEHDGSKTQNFVLKAKGTLFSNQEASLDVNTLFATKNDKFTFGEATGWAAPTLLIINTKTNEAEQGPTYWLDVNRLTLQQLSTKF